MRDKIAGFLYADYCQSVGKSFGGWNELIEQVRNHWLDRADAILDLICEEINGAAEEWIKKELGASLAFREQFSTYLKGKGGK